MSTPALPDQKRNDADTTPTQAPGPRNRFGLSIPQVAGSSLAAVTSAFAASTLGVAGTLIGAAVGSIVITVGGAIYAHTFRSAHLRIEAVVPLRPTRSAAPTSGAKPLTGADLPATLEVVVEPSPAERAARRWRAIATGLAGLLLAVAAITAIEVLIGHPLGDASESGTSVTRVGTDRGTSSPEPTTPAVIPPEPVTQPTPSPTATPIPTGSPSPEPTSTPTQTAPTPDPTPTP